MKNFKSFDEFLNEGNSTEAEYKKISKRIVSALNTVYDYDEYEKLFIELENWCKKNYKKLMHYTVYHVSNKYKDFEKIANEFDEDPKEIAGFIESIIDDIEDNY